MESCNVNSGFSPRMLTISRVPKYSVVPGSILLFVEARRSEVEDSVTLGVWVFELLTQLGWISHKETEFVTLISFEFSVSLLRSSEFCVINHDFCFWAHVWLTISLQLITEALNNDFFFWYVREYTIAKLRNRTINDRVITFLFSIIFVYLA